MYPSELNLLKRCTGFVKVGADISELPRTDEARAEGIAAHSMHEAMLYGKEVDRKDMSMFTNILGAVEYVRKVSAGYPLYIEQKLDLSMIQAGMKGTGDTLWYNESQRDLNVYDLKYGRVKVEAENNWQLLVYAAPFVEQFQPDTVTLHIYQPKVEDPVSTHTYSAGEYRERLSVIRQVIAVAHSDQAMCTAGPHCRYCNCMWSCQTASHYIIEGMLTIDSPKIEDESNLAAKLSFFRDLRKLAAKKEEQLKAIVTAKLTKGTNVPAVKIVPKKTRACWRVPDHVLLNLLPPECVKHKPLTPNQVITGKFLTPEMVHSLSKRGTTSSLKIMKQEDYKCLTTKQES